MSLIDWFGFSFVNLFAASAIAIDACILVLLKFKDFATRTTALKWAGAVALTHSLFPLIGFIGGWAAIQLYDLAVGVYSLGAVLLGLLIFMVLRDSVTYPRCEGASNGQLSTVTKLLGFWIPVLFVSWDALMSGPGKTVLLERYPQEFAWLSFLMVGLLVGLFTLCAGEVSRRIHKRWIGGQLATAATLGRRLTAAIVGEVVLFSFFLIWCVVKVAENLLGQPDINLPLPYLVLAGLVTGATVSAPFYRKIRSAQEMRATF